MINYHRRAAATLLFQGEYYNLGCYAALTPPFGWVRLGWTRLRTPTNQPKRPELGPLTQILSTYLCKCCLHSPFPLLRRAISSSCLFYLQAASSHSSISAGSRVVVDIMTYHDTYAPFPSPKWQISSSDVVGADVNRSWTSWPGDASPKVVRKL